ncbi:MAG: acetyl-CoA carboxylase biotin carboxyl carrier protein [Sphingomicrobium sp.]
MAEAPKSDKGGAMRIDPKLVRALAELLREQELTEIEVEDGDRKIKVKREPPAMIAAAGMGAAFQTAAVPAPALSAPPMAGKEDLGVPAEAQGAAVKSPMVGTAFLSAQPGSDPFVSIGDTVKEGDTLLIIEAMKVMNPITAPEGGTVKQILVSDAQPVEFDQPLVVIG